MSVQPQPQTQPKIYRPEIPSPARRRLNRAGRGGLQAAIIAFFTFFSAFPFYWMLIATFKTNQDLYRPINNPFIFNQPPTMENLELLFNRTNYTTWLANSLIIGVAVVIITLLLAVPAAYALARLSWRVGEQLGGDPLILADAAETRICVLLSISTLLGLVVFTFTGAGWVDPVAGFVIAVFAVKEGREAWDGELVEDDDDD